MKGNKEIEIKSYFKNTDERAFGNKSIVGYSEVLSNDEILNKIELLLKNLNVLSKKILDEEIYVDIINTEHPVPSKTSDISKILASKPFGWILQGIWLKEKGNKLYKITTFSLRHIEIDNLINELIVLKKNLINSRIDVLKKVVDPIKNQEYIKLNVQWKYEKKITEKCLTLIKTLGIFSIYDGKEERELDYKIKLVKKASSSSMEDSIIIVADISILKFKKINNESYFYYIKHKNHYTCFCEYNKMDGIEKYSFNINVFNGRIVMPQSFSINKKISNNIQHVSNFISKEILYKDNLSKQFVGVMDTGKILHIDNYEHMIEVVKTDIQNDEYQEGFVGAYSNSHGEAISTLISFGHILNPKISDEGKIVKVKYFETFGENTRLPTLMKRIEYFVKNNLDIKIWNLSFSLQEVCDPLMGVSHFGIFLDDIQYKYKVMFIIAASNYDADDNDESKYIKLGADSIRGLTVSSSNLSNEKASYSRRGFDGWNTKKPDISYYGGDAKNNDEYYIVNKSYVYKIGTRDDKNNLIDGGTSYAAPLISRKFINALEIKKSQYKSLNKLNDYQHLLFIKGKIIHSAWINSVVNNEINTKGKCLNIDHEYLGYGVVPNKIIDILNPANNDKKINHISTFVTNNKWKYVVQKAMPPLFNDKFNYKIIVTIINNPIIDNDFGVDSIRTSSTISLKLHDGSNINKINDKKIGDKWRTNPVSQYQNLINKKEINLMWNKGKWSITHSFLVNNNFLDKDGKNAKDLNLKYSIVRHYRNDNIEMDNRKIDTIVFMTFIHKTKEIDSQTFINKIKNQNSNIEISQTNYENIIETELI